MTCLADIVQRHARNLEPASKPSSQAADKAPLTMGTLAALNPVHARSQNGVQPPPEGHLNASPVGLPGNLRKANVIFN